MARRARNGQADLDARCRGTGVAEEAAKTGLLDILIEQFQEDTGIRVDFIVTGTGRALTHLGEPVSPPIPEEGRTIVRKGRKAAKGTE